MCWGHVGPEHEGHKKRTLMKEGSSLATIATELSRQLTVRKDYHAPSDKIEMVTSEGSIGIKGILSDSLGITEHAHSQFSDRLSIPKKYYDRMRQTDPELLAHNVNTWLHREPENRLIRTLDGKVRAFLSSSYRALDNYDLAEAALPVLQESKCEVVSAELTETKMYVKAILPSLTTEITGSRQRGDVVQAGIVISNSEVGNGSVKIEPMIYRLVCTNGMIAPDSSLRKYHIGKGADVDGVREMLTDEARQADDKAFWLKVRDIVRGAFNRDIFLGLVNKIEAATQNQIVSTNLMQVVEVTANKFALPESNKHSILTHLCQGGDLSQWGLVNAVTRTANDASNYENATELERTGGKILELPAHDWKVIATAA